MLSDIYAAIDRQKVTLLGLLDLSAAFDCIHDILLRRVRIKFGIDNDRSALHWMRSFLLGCTLHNRYTTEGACLPYCNCCLVSLKGPFWAPYCSCFTHNYELFDVVADCGFSAHSYADDTHVYVCIQALDHTDAIV